MNNKQFITISGETCLVQLKFTMSTTDIRISTKKRIGQLVKWASSDNRIRDTFNGDDYATMYMSVDNIDFHNSETELLVYLMRTISFARYIDMNSPRASYELLRVFA